MVKVPLFKPPVGAEELQAVAEVFESRWLGLGPKTAEFEKQFAAYVGVKHAVGVNSCTAALHLALEALDVKGGEVIVPAITFVSTAHAAVYNGAIPVFADVDAETLCLDVNDLERKITPHTRAVAPVHLGGHPCDMDAVMAIARAHGLAVVEDVANAAGGSYKGRKLGSTGDFGCFSFEAKKNMTTGDGGMITTNRTDLLPHLKRMRWVGIDKDTWRRFSDQASYSWYYEISELGYKYNMNDIQAAIGLVQLGKLDDINATKRRIIRRYCEAFAGLDWLQCPVEREWAEGAYWLFIVKVPDRERFMAHMTERGITTGVHFMPVHLHPYYRRYQADVPVAERVWQHIVTLPLFAEMTEEEFDAVVSAVRSFKP